jgi:hypothetical protein
MEGAPVESDALAHAEKAIARGRAREGGGKAAPVTHPQRERTLRVVDDHLGGRPIGVPERVGERLLKDSVGG